MLGIPDYPSRIGWDRRTEDRINQSGSGRTAGYGYGRSGGGGPINPYSGMGMTGTDKTASTFYAPDYPKTREAAEIPFVQSWAMQHALSIPAFVTMAKWRRFIDDEAEGSTVDLIKAFEKAEQKWLLPLKIADAMVAGNIWGTALLVAFTDEAPLTEPIDYARIRPGSLKNLVLFDRYYAHVKQMQEDYLRPGYGDPEIYTFYPDDEGGPGATAAAKGQTPARRPMNGASNSGRAGNGRTFDVHASRVFRFDGLRPIVNDGWTAYSNERSDWGLSLLTSLLITAIQDQSVASAMTQAATEASMMVVKLHKYRDYLSGEEEIEAGEVPDTKLAASARLRSMWRVSVMDKNDEVERLNIPLAGWDRLSDQQLTRIAASAQIPQAYFLGRSPGGLDSSGDSDMENFALRISALERYRISPILDDRLDLLIAKDAGLDHAPDYEWNMLIDLSDQERAEILDNVASALEKAVNAYAIDNAEFREVLNGLALTNNAFSGPAPEVPEPEEDFEDDDDEIPSGDE